MMVRAFVLYADKPDPERYAEHVEFCRRVFGATFRHGSIFDSPGGEPKYRYYAEFEFPDRETFDAAVGSPEFRATGIDAVAMGGKFEVYFANVD
jgi:hypothetical protein